MRRGVGGIGRINRIGNGDGFRRPNSRSGVQVILLLGVFLVLQLFNLGTSSPLAAEDRAPFRILHVMSYHTPWKWTENQLQGFKDALSGLRVEHRVFEDGHQAAQHHSVEGARRG